MSLNRATHVKFSLSANDKIDYMLALVQLGSAWAVTIITGAGTFFMVSQGMQQYNPPTWVNYSISSVIAFVMWLITDLALGNFIEIIVHNTISLLYKHVWIDIRKNFKKKLKGHAAVPAASPAPGSLGSLATPQPAAAPAQDDDLARYSITSRIIQVGFTIALAKLVIMFYTIDYTAVKTIQQPIADQFVKDTTRNLEAERKAIIAQTQPNIDRVVAEIAKVDKQLKNAWQYSLDQPSMKPFKKLLPKDQGWARGQIEAKFYNKYKAGLDEQMKKLLASKEEYEADQKETLSAINSEVKDFNQKNKDRVEAQTGIIFTSIFALGFMAKQAYGGAVGLRTLWYMSETNGGVDVDGDGKLTRADMHAYQSGKRANSQSSTSNPNPNPKEPF